MIGNLALESYFQPPTVLDASETILAFKLHKHVLINLKKAFDIVIS